jgi:hypothetical protein
MRRFDSPLSTANGNTGIEQKPAFPKDGRAMVKPTDAKAEPDELKGWHEIASFLGQPVSLVQRWADSGMPVEKRGRYVYSSRARLNAWLRREAVGEPVQIATGERDLTSALERGLEFVRKQKRQPHSRRNA